MLRKRVVLGELEVKVLNVLWDRGPSSVQEVLDGLPEGEARHYNTVATVLTRLSAKEIVRRERRGRGHVFSAAVGREELGRRYLELFRKELFGGSLDRMVAALLSRGKPRRRQVEEIRKLLDEMEGRK